MRFTLQPELFQARQKAGVIAQMRSRQVVGMSLYPERQYYELRLEFSYNLRDQKLILFCFLDAGIRQIQVSAPRQTHNPDGFD